ncbi:phosphomethylpyrimidine kinase [Cryptobacterium curtum DSM 15641]|uniref:Phosphomethylpyrimidine kinase n=1 Tax=Cryptobacterium curtum (strain ATCC 700683 / DSM 15641 / CCUG 43107 / 12-3) TaxID=469378 RepID=C7MNZ1_CRYCD|nr:bifunctional hydroxymethylpyrimidine kinase/phosphomethylpyrimidine kinase [Cryptobacterium curtum]ACU94631.1 phosphomethylpyrimidine kinase [Cryptobacterium curtum DSM 15641]
MIPAVLSIAGSDSSGGAGIQADIKTITAQRLYAETVITALTAQNTLGVTAVQNATPEFVLQQIDTVFDDIRPDAVKIGMVSSAEIAHAIASGLTRVKASNIVLDPVMVATSGAALLADDAVQVLIDELLPLADIVTPNIPEAQVLSGIEITSAADMLAAAQAIQRKMNQGKWVLVKGGHLDDGANDLLLTEHGREVWLHHRRIDTPNTHGTGCTLSSAIACGLAQGFDMQAAVSKAKQYLSGALENNPNMGKGTGPLDHMWEYR